MRQFLSCAGWGTEDGWRMKSHSSPVLLVLVAGVVLFTGFAGQAQYKSPKQYFRKDSPGVNGNGYGDGNGVQRPSNTPGTPGTPTTPAPGSTTKPAAPPKPSFKDVAVNATFYFQNDTNRAF